jgi:hypothetical protein
MADSLLRPAAGDRFAMRIAQFSALLSAIAGVGHERSSFTDEIQAA